MPESKTTLEIEEGVAVLTLDRAEKRNALSRALRDEIVQRLEALAKDDSVRVVLLTGNGPVFCAGFDRSELASGDMEAVFSDAMEYHRRVYTFPKPLVAAVNGPALGGGCDLAVMCDFRLAAESAVFGQPQVRFGAAAAYDLMRVVLGSGVAREMCLTGRTYAADEALRIGLVNRLCPADGLREAALAVAGEIASLPAGLAEATKRGFLAEQPRLFES